MTKTLRLKNLSTVEKNLIIDGSNQHIRRLIRYGLSNFEIKKFEDFRDAARQNKIKKVI